jgi:hypothetical protein
LYSYKCNSRNAHDILAWRPKWAPSMINANQPALLRQQTMRKNPTTRTLWMPLPNAAYKKSLESELPLEKIGRRWGWAVHNIRNQGFPRKAVHNTTILSHQVLPSTPTRWTRFVSHQATTKLMCRIIILISFLSIVFTIAS